LVRAFWMNTGLGTAADAGDCAATTAIPHARRTTAANLPILELTVISSRAICSRRTSAGGGR
jgi:hypothetical protein